MSEYKSIEELKGKTLSKVEQNGNEEIVFTCEDGTRFHMYHEQDCCESVWIDRIDGSLNSLIGEPIKYAKEVPGHGDPAGYESVTFTDFHLKTKNAHAVIHWIGSSNGYYSESVYFVQI